ncbi:myb-like DNA-binding domain-containing protein [Phlyctema vagabunda]|uniref:Myb-like DNA-binding domain-containing protein n=1 Tax=Phlyctema vagabunda TaxID=108571 RepID=A0ABR4P3Z6_9HELO
MEDGATTSASAGVIAPPAAPIATDETHIKYESPYGTDDFPRSPVHPVDPSDLTSPSLKRPRSSGDLPEPEKRQKVEAPQEKEEDAFDLASLIAQATASVTQHFAPSPQVQPEEQPQHPDPLQAQPSVECQDDNSTPDPYLYMRVLSLPILESLSLQVLSRLSQGPYSDTILMVTNPTSDSGQAYMTLKSLFDQTKQIYTRSEPFLSADELNIHEPEHRATIRSTNLATFASSVFGGQDVGFYQLNDHFIETFTPDGEPMEKQPGLLYLNFKTQMYLSALSEEEQDRTKEEILEGLFPDSLQEVLASRHPGTPLTQAENEFMGAIRGRREYLLNEPSDPNAIQVLSEKFAWEDFLRNLSKYLGKVYEPLLGPYMKRQSLTAPVSPPRPSDQDSTLAMFASQHEPVTESAALTAEDIIEQAKRAAEAALESVGYSQGFSATPQQVEDPQQPMFQQHVNHNPYSQDYSGGAIPFPTQTAPTQVLYEQARQAAVAKANPSRGRPGLPSQRRPWSNEEENALMAGLDQVRGPHWSQILALYGSKGSISEILKDRNQVQLKDKARNLKLFFLKSNIEVPYYLQCVTGELKTRAPSQAARKEAEERARLATDEEQARFNGNMTLTGSLQDPGRIDELYDEEEEGSLNDFDILDVQSPSILPSTSFNADDDFKQQLIAATAAEGNVAVQATST